MLGTAELDAASRTFSIAVHDRDEAGGDKQLAYTLITSAGAVRFLTRKAVGIAPNVGRYPFMLHFGAKRAGHGNRAGYPARPFLVWTDQSRRKADQLAEAFVKKQTDKIQINMNIGELRTLQIISACK